MINPDYMPLRSLVVQPDATYVAPYREQVFKTLNDINPLGFMEQYKMAPHLFR